MFFKSKLINNTLAICLLGLSVTACFESSEKKGAKDLLKQATEAVENKEYDKALSLIDSIDKVYPNEIDIRRSGMPIRSKAMTASLERQLFMTDSLIGVYEIEIKKLTPNFQHIDVDDAPGYYIYKGAWGNNIAGTTAVQARISDNNAAFYIAASNSGDKIGINQITVNALNGSRSTPVIPAGDSRRGDLDVNGIDLATFSASECDSLGNWAYNEAVDIKSVTLKGERGQTTINLTPQQAEQFGQVWRMALLSGKMITARHLKDKLQRQIVVSRDHEANLE